jgi:hypothetical protein
MFANVSLFVHMYLKFAKSADLTQNFFAQKIQYGYKNAEFDADFFQEYFVKPLQRI